MADPSVTLVIATTGRPTLARTLASLRGQRWAAGDEVLLVADGASQAAERLWRQFGLPGRYVECPGGPHRDWGHSPRNWVMDQGLPRADLVAALDDDDEWVPGALSTIREATPVSRPAIFRMDATNHAGLGILWKEPVIQNANVGTPMLVAPNHPPSLGRYTLRYNGDLDFIRQTCEFYPGGPKWCPQVITVVRPSRN